MQNTNIKFCEFNSNRIQTQYHYFLPNWCRISILEMELCPSFKLILVELKLATQFVFLFWQTYADYKHKHVQDCIHIVL